MERTKHIPQDKSKTGTYVGIFNRFVRCQILTYDKADIENQNRLWRRKLRISWTAFRTNVFILKKLQKTTRLSVYYLFPKHTLLL